MPKTKQRNKEGIKFFLIFFQLFFSILLFSQNETLTSLLNNYETKVAKNDTSSIITILSKGEEIAIRESNDESLMFIFFELSKQYEQRGMIESALKYRKKHGNLLAKTIEIRKIRDIQYLVGFLVLGTLVFFIYETYRRNKKINDEEIIKLKKEKEVETLKATILGQETERRRIAKDLHDGLGTLLAGIQVRFDALGNNHLAITNGDNYQKTKAIIEHACANVREISHNMTPTILSEQGLGNAIQEMCSMFSQKNDLDISFIDLGVENPLEELLELNIYRITQELLKNVIKHAKAKEVIVQLLVDEDLLTLLIEDDGVGFDTKIVKGKNGIGLESIYSRVAYHNGEVDLQSEKNVGTSWTITFKVEKIEKQKIW